MDRSRRLQRLTEELAGTDDVADAWTAKSFTDRLLVVEVDAGRDLPDRVRRRLREHDLVGYNEVHDVSAPDPSFSGDVDDRRRHRFVDLRARGEMQSYVVE
jgi:hypothetical protein